MYINYVYIITHKNKNQLRLTGILPYANFILICRLLLRPVLSGLAKFGHLMSIDFFQDLLHTITSLLNATTLAANNNAASNNEKVKTILNEDEPIRRPLLGKVSYSRRCMINFDTIFLFPLLRTQKLNHILNNNL